MATIRVRDWTKERIEEIREEESHSSHDSVIKGLLKDRELAQFAGEPEPAEQQETPATTDGAFDDLTVVAELVSADNGVLFLWCPNCGHEIAHLGVENPVSLFAVEAECQRCLTRLDQHAIVGIEIGYPIEERLVSDTLESDLRTCVIDYWDRSAQRLADGTFEAEVDDNHLLWQFGEYYREFGWEWPPEVPVIAIEPGQTYRDDATDEYLEILDRTTEHRTGLDGYRIRRSSTPDGDGEIEELTPGELLNLLLSRSLYVHT